MTVEGPHEILAIVVVPRDEVERHGERSEDVAQTLVLVHLSALDEVAGCEHHVGPR